MISKEEILSVAGTAKLLPTTVEKDYALSWALYGISKHPALSQWLFKGGTCLKKCHFETYRFSEDLDFTVPKGAIYEQNEIEKALGEVATTIYEEAGIEVKIPQNGIEESINKNGSKTYIAKIAYAGPLGLPARQQQRIKFDITNDEIIVDEIDTREVFHTYSDAPTPPARVRCYSINEILAEKARALYERNGRARDVFDIVNISRSFREDVDIGKAKHGLEEKFKFKSIEDPSVDLILSRIDFDQLRASWQEQLAHQLQMLPPVESFYNDLRPALSWWIDNVTTEPILTNISAASSETVLPRVHFPEERISAQRSIGIGRQTTGPLIGGIQAAYLDRIRYAARNRLCVEIDYHGVRRLVEPYSLRRPSTGNLLLYVYELRRANSISQSIKAYKVPEIGNVEITQQVFSPRYNVEL